MNESFDIKSILKDVFAEIENRALGESLAGIPVHFYDLDAMTQGLKGGDFILLGGRPAMGKTSFSLNIARNIAILRDLPVCIFSMNVKKDILSYRLLSMELGIESGRLRTGRITKEEWPLLGEGINSLSNSPIHIIDISNIGTTEINKICQRIKDESNTKRLGLIVIDDLQLMNQKEDNYEISKEECMDLFAKRLKNLAVNIDVPIILNTQLSRDVEWRENKRPVIRDIPGTDGLINNADIIMMLYRDEYYDADSEDRGITEISIHKNRNGPLGTIKLLFEPQFTRFRNLKS